ncbi:toluene monooxygenase system protein B [Paraburkholderia sp. GAS199]|uniref:toluene-4-monooxygenase system B family protein n=1 Tax=Paraburkholderia sp. GAS199 TaxID=3035126 RepID=UPI003D208577
MSVNRTAQQTPLPINAHFIGDIVTQLVFVLDTDTIAQVADKIAEHVVGIRVARRDAPMVVYFNGAALPMGETVGSAGIRPLHCLTVRYAE